MNAKIVPDPDGSGQEVLAVKFRADKYASESGAQFYADYDLKKDKALLEYSVYFPSKYVLFWLLFFFGTKRTGTA